MTQVGQSKLLAETHNSKSIASPPSYHCLRQLIKNLARKKHTLIEIEESREPRAPAPPQTTVLASSATPSSSYPRFNSYSSSNAIHITVVRLDKTKSSPSSSTLSSKHALACTFTLPAATRLEQKDQN